MIPIRLRFSGISRGRSRLLKTGISGKSQVDHNPFKTGHDWLATRARIDNYRSWPEPPEPPKTSHNFRAGFVMMLSMAKITPSLPRAPQGGPFGTWALQKPATPRTPGVHMCPARAPSYSSPCPVPRRLPRHSTNQSQTSAHRYLVSPALDALDLLRMCFTPLARRPRRPSPEHERARTAGRRVPL
ncbi:hypothetical protein BC834DRAFT_288085 [Gloeopeniophorella convolvens]|nr:hypothetical protein BC834DRAFT_288085 [Gloeopeniophorella convolvens]